MELKEILTKGKLTTKAARRLGRRPGEVVYVRPLTQDETQERLNRSSNSGLLGEIGETTRKSLNEGGLDVYDSEGRLIGDDVRGKVIKRQRIKIPSLPPDLI